MTRAERDECKNWLLNEAMKLRASNCIFALPRCQFNLYKRSFVLRSLFEDAY